MNIFKANNTRCGRESADLDSWIRRDIQYTILWIPDLFLLKHSLLLSYRRISTTNVCRVKIATWTVGASIAAWAVASLIIFIYQCDPIYYSWDRSYKAHWTRPTQQRRISSLAPPPRCPNGTQLDRQLPDIAFAGSRTVAFADIPVEEDWPLLLIFARCLLSYHARSLLTNVLTSTSLVYVVQVLSKSVLPQQPNTPNRNSS